MPPFTTTLPNGMTLLISENPAADIISARFFVRAGSRYEPLAKAGLSHLLAAVITKGTERLNSQEIAERVESVGAGLGTDAAADYCLLSLKTVSSDFGEMLDLVAELMRSPSFPESEVELERKLTLQGIRSMQEQPFAIANVQLRRSMYPSHPYGLPNLGTETTVATLGREDLLDYHQTYFRPDNLIVSIAGRITPEQAIAQVESTFGDWQAPETKLVRQDPVTITPDPQRLVTVQDTQQAIVMLGYLAGAVDSSDYAALKLLTTYLGNGLSSRLFVELREKRGLAYEVSAFYPTRLDTSHFVAYIGTAPENTAIALDGLKQEVDRLCETVLTDEELQSAKNKLLGQYALGKQTNAQIAQTYGWYETLGLGVAFDDLFQQQIAEVTAAAAQTAAQRFLMQPYVSLVGSAIAAELAGF
jgi:zinc protease